MAITIKTKAETDLKAIAEQLRQVGAALHNIAEVFAADSLLRHAPAEDNRAALTSLRRFVKSVGNTAEPGTFEVKAEERGQIPVKAGEGAQAGGVFGEIKGGTKA